MKVLLLLMVVFLWSPVQAAAPDAKAPQAPPTKEDSAPATESPVDATIGKGAADNEYISPYYKVMLPDGWKAVMPPHEQQGNISAIFATNTTSAVVTMIIGPNDGADAQTIASMFAEQFKATGHPVEKNGQYTFKFTMQSGAAQAWVATQGSVFMVTAISGNFRQAQEFLRRSVTSDQWRGLLPK